MGIILGIIIVIVGIVLIVGAYYAFDNEKKVLGGILVGSMLPILIAFIFVPFGFYQVRSGEIAVVRTYGEIKGVKTPGLHFRNIVSQNITKYDTKVQQVKLEKWIYVQDQKNVTQAIQVVATVQFQIDNNNVKNISERYGTLESLTDKLEVVILGTLESSSEGLILENLITGAGKSQYQLRVVNTLKTGDTQEKYYLNFNNIVVQEFVLEEDLEIALMKIRIAEAEKAAAIAKYEQETERVKAEAIQAEERAKGEANAARAKAEGDAEALMIIAQAEADKITIIAQAEALAVVAKLNELIDILGIDEAKALAHIENLALIEKWNGILPEIMLSDGSFVFPIPTP